MADTPLKSVRARKIVRGETGSGKNGELDLKVSVYKAGLFNNKRKVEVTDASGNKIPGKDPIEYTTNGRYSDYEEIDYIRDYLDTQSKLGGSSASTVINGKEVPVYQILQDPWESGVPLIRDFGYDPYFFNNGVKVQIYWFFEKKTPVGTYSDVFDDNKVKTRYKSTLIPDGGPEWCDPREREISRLERSSIIRGTFSEFGGAFIKPNEITKFQIVKTVKLIMPDGKEYGIAYLPESERKSTREREIDELVIMKYSDKKRYETIKEDEDTTDYEYYRRDRDDWNILNNIKELYCLQLERNKFIKNQYEYDLELCKPDYESCKLIDFIDPIDGKKIEPEKNPEPEKKSIETTDGSKTNATGSKIKLNVQIPNDFKVSANKDMPTFQIFVGDIPVTNIYREEEYVSEEDTLDEEFIEFNYNEPNPNAADETEDPNDPNRGSPDAEKDSTTSNINQSNESTTSTSTSTTSSTTKAPGQVKTSDPAKVKEALTEATQSTGPGPGGKCARFTFNHANNFIRILLGKEPQGAKNAAGGNANQEGYHSALEKVGYKRTDQGTLSKKEIISYLNKKDNWNIGDVVAYWGVDAPSSELKNGGVQYGHTQIFTDGAHGTNHLWTSDDVGNFKCNFVYGKYQTDKWRFIIFKSPHTTDDGKKKLGLA